MKLTLKFTVVPPLSVDTAVPVPASFFSLTSMRTFMPVMVMKSSLPLPAKSNRTFT